MVFLSAVWLAWFLDLLVGDPRWIYHPVQAIGFLCIKLEKLNREIITNEKAAGILTVLEVLSCVAFCCFTILYLFYVWSSTAMVIAAVILLYTTLALRDLLSHSKGVMNAFLELGYDEQQSLVVARNRVAMIVGRDTETLDKEGVIRACVESVAENMSDGVIAPLFYGFLGASLTGDAFFAPTAAALAAMLYKAINTMDSLFGYKNERYLHFGWFAAKCDDLVNLVPARIAAVMIVLAALFLKHDPVRTFRIMVRDRFNHSSPNSGYPEAAMAGALNIQLGGPNYYFGEIVQKPFLGDPGVRPNVLSIRQANQILFLGSFITIFLFSLCYKLMF